MERKTRIDALGAVVLVTIMLTLGLNQVAVKIVNDGMAPVFQAGMRSLAAVPVIFLYCLWRKAPISIARPVLIPSIVTGIFFGLEFALLFQALQYTTVARASIFFYTMPFWVALCAHFLIPGEKLTPIRILGLVLAGAGVVIALAGQNKTAGRKLCAVGRSDVSACSHRLGRNSNYCPHHPVFHHQAAGAAVVSGDRFKLCADPDGTVYRRHISRTNHTALDDFCSSGDDRNLRRIFELVLGSFDLSRF